MRVAFFGQSGPYSPAALRRLLSIVNAAHRPCVVVQASAERIGRGVRCLRPGRIRPDDGLYAGEDLAQTALMAGIEVLQTGDVNAADVVHTLGRMAIDMLICAGFPCLFGPQLIATAKRGALNAHPSLLPRWRGPCPLFWALKANEKRSGVTIHHIDALEDHGPVVAQEAFALLAGECGRTLYARAGKLAGSLLATALSKAAEGQLSAVPQQHGAATRAPRPRAEDAYIVPARWQCEHLVNFATGAAFFRALWMKLGGDTYHIRSGLEASSGRRLPGEFVLHKDVLLVPCRDGTAALQVQS